MNDQPIHLSSLTICETPEHGEPSVTVPVWITQSNLDGLNALIRIHEGFQLAGKGSINGDFELVVFYRTLQRNIMLAEVEARRIQREVAANPDRNST